MGGGGEAAAAGTGGETNGQGSLAQRRGGWAAGGGGGLYSRVNQGALRAYSEVPPRSVFADGRRLSPVQDAF